MLRVKSHLALALRLLLSAKALSAPAWLQAPSRRLAVFAGYGSPSPPVKRRKDLFIAARQSKNPADIYRQDFYIESL